MKRIILLFCLATVTFASSARAHMDPDGRFGKGISAGFNDAPIPWNASSAFMAGYHGGGITSGFGQGLGEGAAIEGNTFSLGQVNSLNTYANGLQGGVYDFTRDASYVALGAGTLATGGALYGTPAVFNASVAVAYSPYTYLGIAGVMGAVDAYQQGAGPGGVVASGVLSAGFQYSQNPFPIFSGNNSLTLTGVQANKAAGDAWEAELLNNQLPLTQNNLQSQITIRSGGPSGLNVRMDAVGTDAGSGTIVLTDGKASATAPLTPNQTIVYPELPIYGGTVVGAGKPPYVGGTVIPPTTVNIIRKP